MLDSNRFTTQGNVPIITLFSLTPDRRVDGPGAARAWMNTIFTGRPILLASLNGFGHPGLQLRAAEDADPNNYSTRIVSRRPVTEPRQDNYTTRIHCSHDAPGSGQRYKFKHDSQLDL